MGLGHERRSAYSDSSADASAAPLRPPRLRLASASSPSAASAASPAPSPSRSSAVGAATTLTTSVSGSDDQRDACGQRDRAGGELRADLGALDRNGEVVGNRLDVGLDRDGVGVLGDQRAVDGLALDDDVDLDGHLLAAAHDEQVGVLDVAADRVDLERLGQRELLLAVDVEGEHRVGAGVAQHGREVVGVEFEVLRVAAVAVEDGGNLAVATGAARRALAGLGPDRSGQLVRGGLVLAIGVAPVPVVVLEHGQGRNHSEAVSRR